MDDREFRELEEKYYAELRKREKINVLRKQLKSVQDILETLRVAKDSPYNSIGGLELVGYISCSDCEGRSEISRDNFSLELEVDEVIEIFDHKAKELKKEMECLAAKNDANR